MDALEGVARVGMEGGAQRLVTAHQLGEGPLQGAHVQRALQPQGHGDAVEGAARLELVQEPQPLLGEGHRRRLGARHGHERGRPGQRYQPAREQRAVDLAGARVQLAPGERLAFQLHGDRVRREAGLGLEEPVQAGVARRGGGGLTPRMDQQVPLLRGEDGHGGERPVRRREDAFEQHPQVAHHPRRRRGLEQVRAVLELTHQPVAPVEDGQGEVELRRALLDVQGVQPQPGPHHLGHGSVLVGEHHLEERGAVGLALGTQGLHQLLEGDVLVLVGAQRRVAHAGEQRAEAGASLQPGAQHQRVDEEADEAFQLRVRPAGDGRADADVVLAGVAGQQRLEGGEHHHGGRGALLPAECVQGFRQLAREVEPVLAAAEALRSRARLVGGELQGPGRALEALAPPAELGLQRLVAQPGALPERVVRVLHRQRLQARGLARGVGRVQLGQLSEEHAHGPAVRDDVVQGDQQRMLLLRQPDQDDAPERARPQVERLEGLVLDEALERALALGLRHGAQVHPARGERGPGGDDLHGLVLVLPERGAQGLMALEHVAQAARERGHVERALQAHGEGQVVGGAVRFQLREEPQALLREREGHRAALRPGLEQRLGRRGPGRGQLLDAQGQGRDGGRREEVREGKLHAVVRADAGQHLRGAQRVAAQLEEVVLGAHRVDMEDAGPERRQLALTLGAGGACGDAGLEGRRSREGLPVHLAIDGEGQGVQPSHDRGHHVLGQPLPDEGVQGPHVQRLGRGDVADQALVAGPVLVGHHHGLAHPGEGEQGGFHLAQLDAVAAHLHLRIRATEELEDSVRAPAGEVSGAVEAGARGGGEGVGYEALRGEGGLLHVAAGQAVAADEQLADDARGHGLAGGVQHVHLRVADGATDGDGVAYVRHGRHAVAGREEGALRGAVAGRHGDAQLLQDTPHVRRAHHVAAGEQLLHRAQAGQVAVDHLREEAGGQVQGGDAVLHQHGLQLVHIRGRVGREDGQACAMEQRAPDFQRGGVEGDGRQEQVRLVGPEVRVVDAEDGAEDGGVGRADALGPAGGAGGEVDVREAAGQGRGRRRGDGLPGEGGVLQHHGSQALGGQLRLERARGDERERARVLQHGGEAFTRVRRVQRDVGAAGLEDGHQRDNQLQRALHGHSDARVGGHAQAAQVPGELVGAYVQLTVGELRDSELTLELDGDLVGEAGDHPGEDLGQGGVVRVLGGGGIPLHQHPLALLLGGDWRHGGVSGRMHGAGLRLLARGEVLQGDDWQRQRAGVARPGRRRHVLAGEGGVNQARQALDGGGLEQPAQGQLHAEGLADAADGLGGQQGVSTQVEEVVAGVHSLDAEELAPQLRDTLLGGSAGRDVLPDLDVEVRRREGPAVHLAVGRERQRRQHHHGRRHHVLGQGLLEVRAQRGAVGLGALSQDDVAHQPAAQGAVLAHHHHRAAHGGVCCQGGLHLAQLDAEATHLHLRVHAAQEVQLAVGAPLHPVSRAVQARPRLGLEGRGQEALRRQRGTAQVAARDAHAAQVQLARHAHGHRLQRGVQDIGAHVGQRLADGGGPPVRLAVREGGHHGALGGAVGVEEAPALAPPLDDVRRAGLAAGDDGAQRGQPRGLRGRQRRGREAHRGDGLLTQKGVQRLTRHQPLQRRQVQRAARAQRGEDFLHGDVEAQVGELQHARAGAHFVGPGFLGHQVAHAAVLHQDALGLTRGAGGVDDVGGVARGGTRVHRRSALRLQLLPLSVQQHHADRRTGEAPEQGLLCHQGAGAAVLQHEGQALPRQGWVQRQVRTAGMQDADERDHQLQRALHADADDGVGAHALAAQAAGELVGPVLQLGVRQALAVDYCGEGLRGESCLLADDRVHGGVVREVRAGTAPLDEQPVALLVVEQGHLGQPQLRPGHQGGDCALHVRKEPLGRGGLEQLGAVLELSGEARSALGHRERHVELRGVDGRFHRAHREPRQLQVHPRHVLQDEHDAEETPPAGLHRPEALEGHVLVGVSVQGDAAHAAQQLAQGGVAVEPGAQHQGVEEEADQALELGLIAAGDGRADDDVVLAGVAAEHELEGGQQGHEGCGALTAAQLRQRGGEFGAQLQCGVPAGVQWRLRAGEVGGQLQVGRAGQLLLPPLELRVERLALQPLTLPDGEVGVLERGLRQGRRLPRGERLEERAQLPRQHPHGPQVRDDVVHRQHQDVVCRPESQQQAPEERTVCQVEGPLVRGGQLALRFLFGRLVSGQVHEGKQEGRGWVDELDGRPVRARAEVGAQRLVAAHQLREASLEEGDVQVSLQPDQERHVVRGAPRLELVQEPQALLREGQRRRAIPGRHARSG